MLFRSNVDGPWRVDYHNNINVQMNYWPACSGNLSECVLPLVDFIKTLVKPGTVTAKNYFGPAGWTDWVGSATQEDCKHGKRHGATSPNAEEFDGTERLTAL